VGAVIAETGGTSSDKDHLRFKSPVDILIRAPHQPSVYLTHQQIVEGLSNRDVARVEAAVARHSEIVIAYLKERRRAETERKEMVRKLEQQLPASTSRNKRQPRLRIERAAPGSTK
jgi:hypothetical protein